MDSVIGCQLPAIERTGRSDSIIGGSVDGHSALSLAQSVREKTLTLKFFKDFRQSTDDILRIFCCR